jgi:phosphatidate cytidylyltransferase
MNARNSRARVALILVLLILLSLRFEALFWILPAMALAVGVVGGMEIQRMATHKGFAGSLRVIIPGILAFVLAGLLPPARFIHWVIPVLAAVFLAAFTIQVFHKGVKDAYYSVPLDVFAPVYIGLPLGLGFQILQVDRIYFVYLLVSVWALDTAAYFVGCRWGRHKMSPVISPKKSWEGAAGGFLGCVAVAVLFKLFVPADAMCLTWGEMLAISALIGVFAQVGDLGESLLKRDAGVKDSGTAFAGHGGVLDRLDSVLFSFMVFYVFLLLDGRVPAPVLASL